MDYVRSALALIGCLFVGAGVGMVAEHYGCSHWLGGKLCGTTAVLLAVWFV